MIFEISHESFDLIKIIPYINSFILADHFFYKSVIIYESVFNKTPVSHKLQIKSRVQNITYTKE